MPPTLDDSFFRALFHSDLGGIAVADLETFEIEEVNEVLLRILGREREEVIGTAEVWRDVTPPEFHPLDERAIRQVLEEGHADPFEKEYLRSDGQRVPVRVSCASVPGYPGKVIVLVTDRSHEIAAHERESAIKRRLEIAISAANQGVWDFDLASGEMIYSDRAKEIYGLPADQPVHYELIRDATHPEDLPNTSAQLQRAIDPALRDNSNYEYRIIRPDGSICWALAFGEAVFEGPPGAEKAVRYVGTIQDITAQKTAERHQNVLVAELNHRVKNVLAVVQSLAYQTLRGSEVPDEIAETFAGRLRALSSAHSLLTEDRWEGANIREIATGALEPIEPDFGQRIRMSGEAIHLNPQMSVSLSMALHELATNAVKYGALSTANGHVELSWEVQTHSDPRLHIHWREVGGPAVRSDSAQGFGTRMIRRVISNNLEGKVDLRFEPGGVECTIQAPLSAVTRAPGSSATAAQSVHLAH